MIDAAHDPVRVRDHRVRAGRAQVGGAEPLQDLVGEAVGGGQRELEGGGVGDARALEVGGRGYLLVGQGLDLRGSAVHEDGAHVERPQHGHVQEDVPEVLVPDHRPVRGHDERLLAELGHVAQDPAQVGRSHRGDDGIAK
jgi:hypothetical protein